MPIEEIGDVDGRPPEMSPMARQVDRTTNSRRLGPIILVTLGVSTGLMIGCGQAGVLTKDSDANQLMTAGIQKLKEKQYDDALRYFRWAAVKSRDATTWALAGDCFWLQGKLEEADPYYLRAVEIDPGHCGARHALGRDAVLLKKYAQAIPHLEKAEGACAGKELSAQNLRFLVEGLLGLDEVGRAESYFRKLQSAHPNDRNTAESGLLIAVKKGDEPAADGYRKQLGESEGPMAGKGPDK